LSAKPDEPAHSIDSTCTTLKFDASQVRDLETALSHERTLLRTIVDLIPAYIYAKDAQSRFVACNAYLARGMGTVSENAIGKTDFDFFPLEMAQKYFDDEQAILKSGEAFYDREEAVLDQIGGDRTIATTKVPLRDESGAPIGIIGIGYDITERKRAEQRMAAGERLESIGRLAAGVAHEINTPIQFLNDSVSFIREAIQDLLADNRMLRASMPVAPEPDENIEELKLELPPALDRIVDGLGRIAEIVRSMKEFSHADQRSMSEVDLNRAIHSTLIIARSEYKYVAEVQTDFQPLPAVICHGGQINQVVLNLVVNAAHAIADQVKDTGQKGLITVKTRVEAGFAVISIGDTGGGIPEAVRGRIFEPFFTTKEVGKGTGQGLSIAHKVVASHGGTLDFVTEMGNGTTFFVRLPLPAADDGAVGGDAAAA
jgi:two-component system NtrC family sensor kinase